MQEQEMFVITKSLLETVYQTLLKSSNTNSVEFNIKLLNNSSFKLII